MAIPSHFPAVKRDQLRSFILFEEASATRLTRKEIPAVAGVKIGDLIDKDGKKLTFKVAADAKAIFGIALEQLADHLGGLTVLGDHKSCALTGGYSQVKEIPQWAGQMQPTDPKDSDAIYKAIIAQLAALEIDVVPLSEQGK